MNDQALAEKIVECGVGIKEWEQAFTGRYITPAPSDALLPFEFVRDPRVAMAMMEKVEEDLFTWFKLEGCWTVVETVFAAREWTNESLPRAINEACAEALSND